MNGIGSRLAAAVMLVVLASSSTAAPQQKQYNLEFLLPTVDSLLGNRLNPKYRDDNGQLNAPVAVTVTVKNESPPSTANSNISSFKFTVSGLALLGSPGDVSCPNAQCVVDPQTATVYVSKISPPIQAQQPFTVTFHATSCVVNGEAFIPAETIAVYTGSSFNGDTFAPFADKPKPDDKFPMVRTLSLRDPEQFDTISTITQTGISCGPISCTQNFAVTDSRTDCSSPLVAGDPICVTTRRGIDKNGAVCTASPVDYFVTNLLVTNKKVHFKWETNSAAAFAYRVNVTPDTAAGPDWQVSWLPTDGDPIFIGAAGCLGANLGSFPTSPNGLPLPSQLTTLASAVKFNDKQIKVTSTPANFTGGPIVIDTERMNVIKVNSNTWTVERGSGFTQQAPHALVPGKVMSTPLPLLTSAQFSSDVNVLAVQQTVYSVNQQAQMCRASASHDNGDGTWSAWFIDIGDGWTLGR
jgi:hypothetical protein